MKKILKALNNLVDMLQEQIEFIKNKNDFEKFTDLTFQLEKVKEAKKILTAVSKALEKMENE
jgi:hypothetical protein